MLIVVYMVVIWNEVKFVKCNWEFFIILVVFYIIFFNEICICLFVEYFFYYLSLNFNEFLIFLL